MFNPSRNQARDFFFDSWRKYRANEALTALETIAVELISQHPEYQPVIDNRDKYIAREFSPDAGETNPFLHLAMHMSIREQVSIDQPQGVRAMHQRLTQKLDSVLDAEHAMMDCLAEMIWQSQRHGKAPDAQQYIACLASK